MDRRRFVESALVATAYSLHPKGAFGQRLNTLTPAEVITIRPDLVVGDLPHVWEECVGSDRAIVGTRLQWLQDLEQVKSATGMKSVRFHGLFNDEMGVWPSGSKGPNFLYVDTVFDAMLARGIKPFVELSFMPGALTSGTRTIFSYRGNVTPPKDMAQWGDLVGALGQHCVQRYGIEEVSTWKFEVWNEPNILFWSGTRGQYFELYRHSANALKSVDKRLQVGGPATAVAAWVGDLLQFCSSSGVPIDFASTHIYPDDPQKDVFGQDTHYTFEEVIPRALQKVRAEIKASPMSNMPLYITEWSSQNPAFIAHTIKGTIGSADMMSYWSFDNVFEELGVPKTFKNETFGLVGMRGVPRPSFYTFALLHKLGDIRIGCDDGPILATRRKDGSLAVLLWNLVPQTPGNSSGMGDATQQTADQFSSEGASKEFWLQFEGQGKGTQVQVTRVDRNNSNWLPAYERMGSPPYPTVKQIEELTASSKIAAPQRYLLDAKKQIRLNIPPNGIALLELMHR